MEFGSKVVHVGGKKVKLQIWDTAGQERFRSVTRSYYRNAIGCLLVFDITCRDTFARLSNWLTDARALARSDIVVCVVGNKCDKASLREVSHLEASRFALENDLFYFETSALTGENVDEVFLKVAGSIVGRINDGRIDSGTLMNSSLPSATRTDAACSSSGCRC